MSRQHAALRRKLLDWYRAHRRDLPWRRTRDPYAIWVSEIMLQQTGVSTVIPYYERFLARFPTVEALARAPEAEVLKRWAGLGYYSRARNLHRAARAVAAAGGGLPSSVEALRELPGIGRYTAGAVASIAFGVPAPLVDGNVIRVLSRLFAVPGNLKSAAGQEAVWELAGKLVAGPDPGDLNQALMELGATVCLPAAPRCAACPAASLCAARRLKRVERYPDLGKRPESVAVHLACAVAREDGRVLIERRGDNGLLSGHWGLPLLEVGRSPAPEAFGAAYGGSLALAERLGTVRHAITFHRVTLDVYRAAPRGTPRAPLRWVPARSLSRFVVSSLFRKALALEHA